MAFNSELFGGQIFLKHHSDHHATTTIINLAFSFLSKLTLYSSFTTGVMKLRRGVILMRY